MKNGLINGNYMTYKIKNTTIRKKQTFEESRIQEICVKWFRYQYPELNKLFFAVPNGGQRNAITAKILNREGVVPGVSDLILLVPRNGFSSLCIEVKTDKGVQSKEQKEFQKQAESNGAKYVIVRSLDDFIKTIEDYLGKRK